MATDLAALFDAVQHAVLTSADPASGWRAVVRAVDATGHRVPAPLRDADVASEASAIQLRVAHVLATEPPPAALTGFYFGLFTAWYPETEREGAGFYVSGGTTADPETAVIEGELAYWPEQRYLSSPLLEDIKAAAPALGPEYNVFDYGLMLGAAALLARHAIGEHAERTVFVGFDSGDYLRVLPGGA